MTMNSKQFVENWVNLKSELLLSFMNAHEESEVAARIEALELTPKQHEQLRAILDSVLRDTMYTLLLGLDGAASIGGEQQTYTLHDEDGNLISDGGELEAAAWEAFHRQDQAPEDD
ncbi:hypothetical protein [Comamonas testosteroni]|nr:hypothetical protein [Comamonas testosteroni]